MTHEPAALFPGLNQKNRGIESKGHNWPMNCNVTGCTLSRLLEVGLVNKGSGLPSQFSRQPTARKIFLPRLGRRTPRRLPSISFLNIKTLKNNRSSPVQFKYYIINTNPWVIVFAAWQYTEQQAVHLAQATKIF
jgi:hypothetical protein